MNNIKFYGVNFVNRSYEFVFRYEHLSDGWRAYILDQPDYEGRDESFEITHRLRDEEGPYVCWDSPIETEAFMDGVVALWSRATVMYIVFGGDIIEYAERIQRS